jgi:hypothetical protein
MFNICTTIKYIMEKTIQTIINPIEFKTINDNNMTNINYST